MRAVGLEPETGSVGPAEIAAIPTALLLDVDARWRACSGGALGFGVQARLWLELGGVAEILVFEGMSADERAALGEVERRFAARVGWRSAAGGWQGARYGADAPRARGALPYLPLMCSYGHGLVGLNLAALASKLTVSLAS